MPRSPRLAVILAALLLLTAAPPAPAPAVVASADAHRAEVPFEGRRVLAISVDGLTPRALRRLGRSGAPAIWSLLDRGAGTLNARSEVEYTLTLPNHVGMITGRPVLPRNDGHGVTWNDDLVHRTVPGPTGGPIRSVLTSVHRAGGSTAVFAGKSKFGIFRRTWPGSVDASVVRTRTRALAGAAARDLRTQRRAFTFVHLAAPDEAGHHDGWLSPAYLDAVREADAVVGRLLAVVQRVPELRAGVTVVLTADHGGRGKRHQDARARSSYTVPFVVAGPGVPAGDLYALSPGLTDPGAARPGYGATHQPVRNCDVANVATTVLGLPPVPGSRCHGALEMPLVTATG